MARKLVNEFNVLFTKGANMNIIIPKTLRIYNEDKPERTNISLFNLQGFIGFSIIEKIYTNDAGRRVDADFYLKLVTSNGNFLTLKDFDFKEIRKIKIELDKELFINKCNSIIVLTKEEQEIFEELIVTNKDNDLYERVIQSRLTNCQ